MDILTAQYTHSDEEGETGIPSSVTTDEEAAGGASAPLQGKAGRLPAADNNEDDEDDDFDDEDEEIKFLVPRISAAPPVSDALLAARPADVMADPIDPSQRQLTFNPRFDQLWTPLEGPAHPHTKDGRALGLRNHRLGSVQDAALDPFVFDEQYNTFQAYGYGIDPASFGGHALVGDAATCQKNEGATVYNLAKQEQRKRKKERRERMLTTLEEKRRKGEEEEGGEGEKEGGEEEDNNGSGGDASGDDGDVTRKGGRGGGKGKARAQSGSEGDVIKGAGRGGGKGKGRAQSDNEGEAEGEEEDEDDDEDGDPQEGVDSVNDPTSKQWLLRNTKSPWSNRLPESKPSLTEEQRKYKEEHEAKKEKKQRGERVVEEEKSTFHGKEETDYQGRSWIAPPKDARAENEHCYIPKRCIHTWSGHTKGVAAIRFFPKSGHLLLSGSMDTKIKIWDVQGSKKCMRTYMGHSKAVKDIWFSNDGLRFLSSSYDRNIKLWDTETGKAISTFSTGKIPYTVRLHPDKDKQNILLAGMSDKKIMQWDTNTGEITQEYDQHLGAVNTITFVDDNRRFVTSSDDKSLRVWEFGIPVVVKYISEPHMHSMPAIAMHPNNHWLAAQSLDNQILIYGTRDRFRLNRKKRFAGHIVAGYACQVGFSPDGRFIMSGDGEGRLWFWDWKTCKVFRTLKCHDSVCIGCEWHPLEQSKVATCGWDGLIKYWD